MSSLFLLVACPAREDAAPDARTASDARGAVDQIVSSPALDASAAADTGPLSSPAPTSPDAAAADSTTDLAPPDAGDAAAPAAFATYTLDLTQVRQPRAGAPDFVGVPAIRARAYAAFPIDLGAQTKVVHEMGPYTFSEWPSVASTCAGFPPGRDYLPDADRGAAALAPLHPTDLLKGFVPPYQVHLRRLDVFAPDVVRDAGGGLCLVMRAAGSWTWRAQRFLPGAGAVTHIELDLRDVDVVAILFEAPSDVRRIDFTIERHPGDPALDPILGGVGAGDLASAACCTLCAADGPTPASRYCCAKDPPPPEPCLDLETPLSPQCRPLADVYAEAASTCRAHALWLRSYNLLDPTNLCVAADRLSPTGTRGAKLRCCRDPYFIPEPPNAGPVADCFLVGASYTPCTSNQTIHERLVESCNQAGLVHRVTRFRNDCPGGGSGEATGICCRPGVAGPPTDYCAR